MNEIFYEIKDIKKQSDLSLELVKDVIFHFLAKAGETLILFETKQTFSVQNEKEISDEILKTLQNIFSETIPSLRIVKGKIREIFLSYSH